MLIPDRKSNIAATPGSPHSTTDVLTFPGFANLVDTKKEQTFNKHSSDIADQKDPANVRLQADSEVRKEHEIRSGYLMPDEELLQKWTNSL